MMQQQFPYNGLTQQRGKQKKKVNSSANHQKKKKKQKNSSHAKQMLVTSLPCFLLFFDGCIHAKAPSTRAHTHTQQERIRKKSPVSPVTGKNVHVDRVQKTDRTHCVLKKKLFLLFLSLNCFPLSAVARNNKKN